MKKLLFSSHKETGIVFLDKILKELFNAMKIDPVCSSFKNTFTEFQKARFDPKPFIPSKHIIFDSFMRGEIRSFPLNNMPRYSAQAFVIKKPSDCTNGNHILLSGKACLEITY